VFNVFDCRFRAVTPKLKSYHHYPLCLSDLQGRPCARRPTKILCISWGRPTVPSSQLSSTCICLSCSTSPALVCPSW